MKNFSYLFLFFLLSCSFFKNKNNQVKYYFSAHRLQEKKDFGKFSVELKINENRSINLARFPSISNKVIMDADIFKWEKGYGLSLTLETTGLHNWYQEMGRDHHGKLILIVNGEYFSNAYYNSQNFKNPIKLYCPLIKEQAEKLVKHIVKNYKIINKKN